MGVRLRCGRLATFGWLCVAKALSADPSSGVSWEVNELMSVNQAQDDSGLTEEETIIGDGV